MNNDKVALMTIFFALALIVAITSIPYIFHGTREILPTCKYNLNKKVFDATFNEDFFLAPEIIIDHAITTYQSKGYELDPEAQSKTANVIDKGFSYKDDFKMSACLEQVDLIFYDKTKQNSERACFAMAYLNNRRSGKIKSVQAMPCDEIEKTMAYWTYVNNVKGMRFIPNSEPPRQ
jgi:hypothetical protein